MTRNEFEHGLPEVSTRLCWICGDGSLVRVHGGNLPATLTSEDFQITNRQYGHMGALDRCGNCGFHQCTEMANVLKYYGNMEDREYEATRESRALQELGILHHISPRRLHGRLLDVGAGSGILIEQAKSWVWRRWALSHLSSCKRAL
jgi:hypothetical protein